MTTPMNLISVKHHSKEWPRLEFQTIFGSFSLFCKISGVKILANLPILACCLGEGMGFPCPDAWVAC